ncbi:Sec-independent protein translocase protein TatB [Sphingomonas antarctica]|uniref:Sec-independent protein translocase protein TatB n=1 Tax=Sphingomonas antarctica TaxID=2040274 RepID=UPI0039E9E936
MFGIDGSEFLLFAVVALVVIGPKDLPKAMRVVGRFVGKARAMSRHFRSGIDAMIREAELEEMETKWKAENERIMAQYADPVLPPPHVEAPAPPLAIEAPAVDVPAPEPELPLGAPAVETPVEAKP